MAYRFEAYIPGYRHLHFFDDLHRCVVVDLSGEKWNGYEEDIANIAIDEDIATISMANGQKYRYRLNGLFGTAELI